ncbi:MAG: hypothetical protein R6X21_12245, partial [Candidatus Aminicenantes bacterium]
MLHRGHEDLAAGDEGDLVAVRRQLELGDLGGDAELLEPVGAPVRPGDDRQPCALVGPCRPNPQGAVEGVGEVAGVGRA